MKRFLLILLVGLAVLPLHAQSTDDARYADTFGITGLRGEVAATVTVGSDVYLAGTFKFAGDVRADNIVRWNRTTRTFHPLGAGLRSAYSESAAGVGLVRLGDHLYVSGRFRYAGEESAYHLARYDLISGMWEAVDVGQSSNTFAVGPIAAVGGVLYVAVDGYLRAFTPGTNAWVDVSSLTFTPQAMVALGSDLYMSWEWGQTDRAAMDDVNGTGMNRIGRFDTQAGTWHALGTGESNGLGLMQAACYDASTGRRWTVTGGEAPYLVHHDSMLYVGGQFATAGGIDVNSLAVYDPVANLWANLGGGVRFSTKNSAEEIVCDYPARVEGLAVEADGAVFVAGGIVRAGIGSGTVFTHGNFPLVRWTAAEGWSALDFTRARGVFSVGASTLLVDGDGLTSGNVAAYYTLGYDTTTDTAFLLNTENAQGITDGSIIKYRKGPDGSLYGLAAGRTVGTLTSGGIVRWDGQRWQAAPSPGEVCGLRDFVFAADGTIYGAGGRIYETWNGQQGMYPCVVRQQGDGWEVLSQEVFIGYSADALILHGDTLYVGGNFAGLKDLDGNLLNGSEGIVQYDLTTNRWHSVGTGLDYAGAFQHAIAFAFAVDPATGVLYVGGTFDHAGGSTISGVARWDGVRWTGIGGTVLEDYGQTFPGTVQALVIENGALYVGGQFTHAGTKAIPGLARYDFATQVWSGFGEGLRLNTRSYPDINALVVRGDEVIVGGSIHRSSDRYGLHNLARWDGTTWLPLGSGVEKAPNSNGYQGAVYALALDGEDLWIGGDFDLAGEKPSHGVARYALPTPGPVEPLTAAVHLLHGAASLAGLGPLEVYVNGGAAPVATIRFSGGTQILTVPAGVPVAFRVRFQQEPPAWMPREITFTETLNPTRYVVSLAGVADALVNGYAANPDGMSTLLRLLSKEVTQASGKRADPQVMLVHTVTDAPAVGVFVEETSQALTYYLPYGGITDPIALPEGRYRFRVERNDNGAVLGTFEVDLTGTAGQVVPVLFAGFLDPSANYNGPGLLMAAIDEEGVSTDVERSPAAAGGIGLLYPNPARDEATVRVDGAGAVEARLYDALGRHVLTVGRPAGSAVDLQVPARALAPGVYFLRVESGGAVATRQLIVAR